MNIREKRVKYYLAAEVCLFAGVLLTQAADWREAEDILVYLCVAGNAACMLYMLFAESRAAGADRLVPCAVMMLTWLADTLLVLLDRYYAAGVGLFCCVQSLYAWCLHRRGHTMAAFRLLVFAVPAACIITGFLPWESGTGDMSLTVMAMFSFSQLLTNAVCASRMAGKSGAACDRVLAAGFWLFLGCDLCVGLRNMQVPVVVQDLAYVLNWAFYVPSQVLIVLSLPAAVEGQK